MLHSQSKKGHKQLSMNLQLKKMYNPEMILSFSMVMNKKILMSLRKVRKYIFVKSVHHQKNSAVTGVEKGI